MTRPTPGPWEVRSNGTEVWILNPSGGDKGTGEVVAVTYEPDSAWTWSKQRAMANARLIAAAPELLVALQETLRVLVTPSGFPDNTKGRTDAQQAAYTAARVALAHATGESR